MTMVELRGGGLYCGSKAICSEYKAINDIETNTRYTGAVSMCLVFFRTTDLCSFFSVFILDSGKHCFVWIGKGASEGEKRNGFCRAHVSFDAGSPHNNLLTTLMVVLTQAHHANVSFVTASPLSFDLLDCVE